jgi:flagellar hook-length control protein FliK
LLSLVVETRAAPAGEASAGESGTPLDETHADPHDPAKDSSNNPLAQLLGWADPRSSAGDSTRTGGAGDAQAMSQAGPDIGPGSAAAANALASAAVKTGGAGVDITGMQPLATPEAINPAALPAGANPAAGRAPGAAAAMLGDARDARSSGTRREVKTNTATPIDATASLRAPATTWQPLTSAAARGTSAAGGSEALRGRSGTWAASTVSMDLSAGREAEGVAGNAVSLTARLSALLAGQAQADGAAPLPLPGATQDAGASPAEVPAAADLLGSTEAALEPEPQQVSHWSTQHLRHAHLRLGEGALDSVDIRLSMQGQDLSVDFRTDNADIRQSLAQQANQSLAALLERSGIALADVSVGAQQQQRPSQGQGHGQGSEPQRDAASARVGRSAAGPAETDPSVALRALAAQPLRADGSRPLDLFV